MNEFSEYDLIQAISGADEDGYSKCDISIKLQKCNADGQITDVDDEFISEKPIVQMSKQPGGYVSVDLLFNSIEDKDLKIIFSYLDRFYAPYNSVSDDEQEFLLLTFAFVPHELKGKFWALGLNPIFRSLTPEDSTGEPRIIRLVFISQDDKNALPNFLFLSSPDAFLEDLSMKAEDEIDVVIYN